MRTSHMRAYAAHAHAYICTLSIHISIHCPYTRPHACPCTCPYTCLCTCPYTCLCMSVHIPHVRTYATHASAYTCACARAHALTHAYPAGYGGGWHAYPAAYGGGWRRTACVIDDASWMMHHASCITTTAAAAAAATTTTITAIIAMTAIYK